MTTYADVAKKIDKAVFPGEQGGPHVNVFAALSSTFKLAQTKQFKKLQAQTIKTRKPWRINLRSADCVSHLAAQILTC